MCKQNANGLFRTRKYKASKAKQKIDKNTQKIASLPRVTFSS